MSSTELEVLRGFYKAVGLELDSWSEQSSPRLLKRMYDLLACAVEQDVPVNDPEPEGRKCYYCDMPPESPEAEPTLVDPFGYDKVCNHQWEPVKRAVEECSKCTAVKVHPEVNPEQECPAWYSGIHHWEQEGRCNCGASRPDSESERYPGCWWMSGDGVRLRPSDTSHDWIVMESERWVCAHCGEPRPEPECPYCSSTDCECSSSTGSR